MTEDRLRDVLRAQNDALLLLLRKEHVGYELAAKNYEHWDESDLGGMTDATKKSARETREHANGLKRSITRLELVGRTLEQRAGELGR